MKTTFLEKEYMRLKHYDTIVDDTNEKKNLKNYKKLNQKYWDTWTPNTHGRLILTQNVKRS